MRGKKRNVPVMPIKFQPRQSLFIQTDDVDEVLYGGAAGGGKTWALLWDAYLHCLKYPGERALLLRRTYPEIRRSFLELARNYFPDRAGKLYYGDIYEFRFYNGSVLEFGHMEKPKDRNKYQSAEYSYIGFDELTHFEEGMYTYMLSRCRSSRPGVPKKMRAATNPGSIGHYWVKKRFIEPEPPMTVFTVKSDTGDMTTRLFIPAKVQDNKILMQNDPGYIKRLNQLPEIERRMLRDGDWDVFAGQAFPELQDIHWIDPFPIPEGWEKGVAMDWGYSKPFAVLWFARDWDNYIYVYREWYGCRYEMENSEDDTLRDKGIQMSIPMVCEGILERSMMDKNIRWWKADPSIWAKKDEKSIADIFAENGIYWQPADNHRIAGKQRLHDLLRTDDKGIPGIRFFKTCRGLRRTLPELVLDEKNFEDVDTEQEDHLYDALRYGIMTYVGSISEPDEGSYTSFREYIKNRRRKGAPSWKVAV